jgi:DNA polymerase-3 subunit gamma/tau
MAYTVLARKYRPKRFADVAGQDHVTVTLMNALTQQRIAHGYIFSGHRGIGKTTVARILAAALNCRNAIGSELRPTAEPCEVCESCTEIRAGNATDVIEIDAATNRGIDEIRELRDAARYRPSRDKYKIYILDEAHQITDAAFNALLKTLEEPPDHVIFMMATTQPEDIPQTVRSRCQHFSFHAVKLTDILSELRAIAIHEEVDADEAALALLAEAGDGSMRDALSIMDQAIASAPVEEGRPRLDAQQIRELMGTVPNAVFERILDAVNRNNSAEVITTANQLLDAGNSPAQLARQAVRYLRNTLMAKISGLTPDSPEGAAAELLQISPDEQRRAARTAALFSEEELTRFLQTMLRTFDELGYRQEQRFHFELGLLKLVHLRRLLPVEQILSQLPGSGTTPTPRPTPTPQPAPTKPAFTQPKPPPPRVEPPKPVPPPPAPEPTADATTLQNAAIDALLAAKGQTSAADALGEAQWTLEANQLRIQTTLSKTMLPVVINPDAEKILRNTLRNTGATLQLLPTDDTKPAAAKAPRPPRSGSAQAKALEHPVVQRAQSLFHAEIRNVIDLRGDD